MNKRILSAVLALGVVLTMNVRALAEPSLDEQLNSSQQQYNQEQSTLNEAQKKVSDIELKIEMLDDEIQKNMIEIDNVKGKISKTEADINNAQKSIKRAEQDIKAEKELYNKRMRAMYINGSGGYINILLDSKGVSDLISKVETIKSIAEFNDKIISNLNERRQAVQEKKDKFARDKEKLIVLKSDSEKKLSDLNNKKTQQQPLIAEAKAQQNSAAELSASTKSQIDAIKQRIASAKAAEQAAANASQNNSSNNANSEANRSTNITANNNSNTNVSINRGGSLPASTGGSVSNDSVIAYASSFLGTPYVWGGTSPSPGFDCSGFTQYVYKKFGVSVGRTTYDQIKDGVGVSRDQLKPGDLVFFGTYSNPHHMGMYVGDGMYIHAPHTGDVVKISPLNRSDYLTARRVK
ncbi:protein P54 [Clostridium pasteurianum DSM 525 = ATCC 6013]|uniref:NLP/P60 protein n=1 Tax=Clostridium pasteurianum DSM 525 = ATCC 6013 TaxID=1262449 RepID=A0A0H3J996_CLOPA|nr:C40 family peptidase [Clostridium pasteurianum]AJA48593.1 protein P54 [Clostridium pasteurianum DSM 525 = ATCC 6013]AJA52581.1 protein P54 [Clostridium pasteurianum DSM 525 = ATCC 6013]AOZ75824.1 glycoside hydrolase [Clostridium pasteurianum DSM 525 = ATCC 6013]AOZ79620.1 glycoside hydrolase [Clostridium pasteurianum]ELP57929.1 NLP/P60 protein [Clostridium pasteurianum DSM 525 = ATCC 6013]